jgi:hypothetical protein
VAFVRKGLLVAAVAGVCLSAFPASAAAPDPLIGTWNLGTRQVSVVQTGKATFVGTRLYSITEGPCTTQAGTKKWDLIRDSDGTYYGTNHGTQWTGSDPSTCMLLPIPMTIRLGTAANGVLSIQVCHAATALTAAECSVWTRKDTVEAPVPISTVANGCGGAGWDSVVKAQNYVGNTSSYRNAPRSHRPVKTKRYTVNFVEACKLHDAGYAGVVVRDVINGGIVDFRRWTRKEVDDKFLRDMQTLCRRQIPASLKVARAQCLGTGGQDSFGAESRYNFVRFWGDNFFDADTTQDGTQEEGDRLNN